MQEQSGRKWMDGPRVARCFVLFPIDKQVICLFEIILKVLPGQNICLDIFYLGHYVIHDIMLLGDTTMLLVVCVCMISAFW